MARSRYVAPPSWRAALGRGIWRVLFRTFYRTTIVDDDLVPTQGPVLMASNHSGLIDGPVVMGLAPRPAHFMVKREMFHGVAGAILRGLGQIPVDRTVADRTAIGTTLAVLTRGDVVGVFPEGSRGAGDVSSVHAGVTFLALASGAPVVPVACLGTRPPGAGPGRLVRPFSRLAVVFGEPFTLQSPAGMPRREANRVLTEELRLRLAAHVHASSERTGIPLHGMSGASPHGVSAAEAAVAAESTAAATPTTDDPGEDVP
ncbi:MAG TPA: lysophospholipid acyltransferase family protein [Actinomycetales bacterium]|nr:lysophospholipid acyltransferase family protein [Actinomycetales bacterium]